MFYPEVGEINAHVQTVCTSLLHPRF